MIRLEQQQSHPSGSEIAAQVREQVALAREQARVAAREAREQAAQTRAEARAVIAQPQGGEPAIVIPPRSSRRGAGSDDIPAGAVDLGIAFFIMIAVVVIGLGLVRAFSRRLEGRPQPASISGDVAAQLQRIEHAVESMSIEVERISEAQRFMARLQSERSPAAGMIGERSSPD
ncbi:MAG: hypothetical protein M3068_01665 [Gemmatimonadota bacterium]|nr:hypothetical protein [Gemmatimonadota bacterium]